MHFSDIRTILCLGAHADDIEIGCGGTLLELARRFPNAHVDWIVFSAHGERCAEAQSSAEAFTHGFASRSIQLFEYRDGFFPYTGEAVKNTFEDLQLIIQPDLILTHCRHDLHQDHRLVCELAWNTWRHHFILEYEIPKYDADLGAPNLFVPLDEETVEEKIEYIMKFFASQRQKHWFEPEVFRALMRIRGVESGGPTAYAEAYYGRKIVVAHETE